MGSNTARSVTSKTFLLVEIGVEMELIFVAKSMLTSGEHSLFSIFDEIMEILQSSTLQLSKTFSPSLSSFNVCGRFFGSVIADMLLYGEKELVFISIELGLTFALDEASSIRPEFVSFFNCSDSEDCSLIFEESKKKIF